MIDADAIGRLRSVLGQRERRARQRVGQAHARLAKVRAGLAGATDVKLALRNKLRDTPAADIHVADLLARDLHITLINKQLNQVAELEQRAVHHEQELQRQWRAAAHDWNKVQGRIDRTQQWLRGLRKAEACRALEHADEAAVERWLLVARTSGGRL